MALTLDGAVEEVSNIADHLGVAPHGEALGQTPGGGEGAGGTSGGGKHQTEGAQDGVHQTDLGGAKGSEKGGGGSDLDAEEHAEEGSEELGDNDGGEDGQEEGQQLEDLVEVEEVATHGSGVRTTSVVVVGGSSLVGRLGHVRGTIAIVGRLGGAVCLLGWLGVPSSGGSIAVVTEGGGHEGEGDDEVFGHGGDVWK